MPDASAQGGSWRESVGPGRSKAMAAPSLTPQHPDELQARSSIDELLALPREQRLAMLADLRAGRPGPRLVVHVPRTVRSLRSDRIDQDG